MPRLTASASKKAKRERVRGEMRKFKKGTLRSGSRKGRKVKSRAQAIAISLSEAGEGRKAKRGKRSTSRARARKSARRSRR